MTNSLDVVNGATQSIDALIASPGADGISLREAILATTYAAPNTTILFEPGMSGRTIAMTGGPFVIFRPIIIDARSLAVNVTIDAQQRSSLIHFTASEGNLTLAGLDMRNGKVSFDGVAGGGIRSDSPGTLTLVESSLSGSSTWGDEARGGGIYARGKVVLDQSTLSGNSTTGKLSGGGGIFAAGAVTINQSSLSGNTTSGIHSDGGGIYSTGGEVTLNQSTLSGNATAGANSDGGGIYARGLITLNRSTVSGNSTAGNSARGGGISGGAITLNQSTLSRNDTAGELAHGGGIATVNGPVTLNQSTLSGNWTTGLNADGGGVYARYGEVTLNDSTLSGNTTAGNGSQGGGIASVYAKVTLYLSTLTANQTFGANAHGGGIFVNNSSVNPALTLSSSILAGNAVGTSSPGPDLFGDPQSYRTITYSVIGTGITTWTIGDNNISTNAPRLSPLAFNGGPTQTHALLAGSPAIDAGYAHSVRPDAYDQRGPGFARVTDGDNSGFSRIDVGAYESQPTLRADFDSNGVVNGSDFLAWQRGLGAPNPTRAQGNSDFDLDVDAVDLAAWKNQFAAPSPASFTTTAVAAEYAREAPVIAGNGQTANSPIAEMRISALDAIYAGGDWVSILTNRPTFRPAGKLRIRTALR